MNTNNIYKEEVFDLINRFSSYNNKLISEVQTSFHSIGYKGELPNIGITLNNKLIEFMHEFRNANVCMFPDDSENPDSTLGLAITLCMYCKAEEALDLIVKYKDDFTVMANKHLQPFYSYVRSGPIKQFFLRIKHFIVNPHGPLFAFDKDELKILNGYFSSYKEIDDTIWNSKLQDYIIPCTINYIEENNLKKNEITEFLNYCIIPDLKSLKLDNLIPELETEVLKLFDLNCSVRKNPWVLPIDYNINTSVSYSAENDISKSLDNER